MDIINYYIHKDGELRGTTSKTVRSSTNLMRTPQLWTRSLTITTNNTGPNFVPWRIPPFRYKGAETEAPTRVTWALPCKKDATHLSKLQWRFYCVESFSINIRWSRRSKPFLKSAKKKLDSNCLCPGLLKPGVKDRQGPDARSIYQLPRIAFYRGCQQQMDIL